MKKTIILLAVIVLTMMVLDHSYKRNVKSCVEGGNTITYCQEQLSK